MSVPPNNNEITCESTRSRKKIAFFVLHRLVPPTGNMGGRKRVRSDKTDMPNFLAGDLDLYPPPISQ